MYNQITALNEPVINVKVQIATSFQKSLEPVLWFLFHVVSMLMLALQLTDWRVSPDDTAKELEKKLCELARFLHG